MSEIMEMQDGQDFAAPQRLLLSAASHRNWLDSLETFAFQIPRQRMMRGLRFLAAVLLAVLFLGQSLSAQRIRQGRSDEFAEDLFLLAPRAQTRLLREGQLAIEEKRYADAIAALGTLLIEQPEAGAAPEFESLQQDFFLTPSGPGAYRSSLKGEALRLLGSLPEEGRKLLEIRHGVTARQQLQAAVAKRDFEAIGEVARRFFHTEAGYDATILLAQEKLVRGYPLAAAALLSRLVEYPAARTKFGAQLVGSLATIWLQAKRPASAMRQLELGAKYFPNERVRFASRDVELKVANDWRKIVESERDDLVLQDRQTLDDWMTTGGTADRNASTNLGMPISIVKWAKSIHRDARDEEAMVKNAARARSQGSVMIPKIEARMLNNLLLVKTADERLMAIDFSSGLYRWPFYFHCSPTDLLNSGSFSEPGELPSEESQELQNRIWGKTSFGQFSCDAQNFYFISDEDQGPLSWPGLLNQTFRIEGETSNFLEGVSIAKEGSIQWRIGGSKGNDEPLTAGAYFLGPPLPLEGQLFVLAEFKSETRLLVLDSTSGRLLWSQQLVHSSISPIGTDLFRQAQALSPSIADGVIICPTGHGAIVAVDLLSRTLRWANHFPRQRFSSSNQFQFGFGMDQQAFDPLAERWHEPAVLIHNGTAIFTPTEEDSIMSFDAFTGHLLWKQSRGKGRYVAGIYGDRVIVVGNTAISSLQLASGSSAWNGDIELPQGEVVCGKSIRQDRWLLVPTSAQRVIKIDLEQGVVVDSATVDRPLGNLFAYKNEMISVSPTEVTVYYTKELLSKDSEERLAKNDADTWALNQKAQLALSANNVDEALALLEKSYELDSQSEDTRYLLVRSLLAGLKRNFEKYVPMAVKFGKAIEFGPQQFEFLVSLAQGNIRHRQYRQAFDRLTQLVRGRKRDSAPSTQLRLDRVSLGPQHEVDADAWIAVELRRVIDAASLAEQQEMNQSIAKELADPSSQSLPILRELLSHYRWLEPAHASIQKLAETLAGGAEQSIAERLLQAPLWSGQEVSRSAARELLERDTSIDQQLFSPLGLDAFDQSLLRTTLMKARGAGNSERPALAGTTVRPLEIAWPRGMVEASIRTEAATRPIANIPLFGNRYARPEFSVSSVGNNLQLTNLYGDTVSSLEYERSPLDGSEAPFRCQVEGGVLLLETNSEVLAVDIYRGSESPRDATLWRHALSATPFAPTKIRNTPMTSPEDGPLGIRVFRHLSNDQTECSVGPITPAGVLIKKGPEVFMLDLLTGEIIWQRGRFSQKTSQVAWGVEVAVMDSSTGLSHVLDCRDGKELRTHDYRGDWKPWTTCGPMVIEYQTQVSDTPADGIVHAGNSPAAIRVFNALTGEEIQRKTFAAGGRASICDNRFVAILETSGKLWFCDLMTGKSVDHQVKPIEDLRSVSLQRFQDRLVLLTLGSDKDDPTVVQERNTGNGVIQANGPFYTLDSLTGRLLWEQPGQIFLFQFSNRQPRGSPFMVFHRSLATAKEDSLGGLAVVDLRDGKLAFATNSISKVGQGDVSVQIDPLDFKYSVSFGGSTVELTFTDEPKPPQPVCNFGRLPISTDQSNPLDVFLPVPARVK